MGRGKGTILTGRRRVDQAGRRIGIQKLPFSPTGRAPIVRKSSVKLSGLSPREPPPSRRLHASKREYERSALSPKDGRPPIPAIEKTKLSSLPLAFDLLLEFENYRIF